MPKLLVPALVTVSLLASCAEHAWMLVPAKVDLLDQGTVGVMAFEGDEAGPSQRATRVFKERLLQARPGVRVVEVDASDAAEHGELDVVFTGTLEFSKLSPSVGVASTLIEVQARAELRGTLSVQMIDPASGAIAWMSSSDRVATVAKAAIDTEGKGNADYADIAQIKANMVSNLAHDVTHDFRDQYFEKRVEDIPPHYEVTYPDGVEVYVPPHRSEL